MSQFAGKTAVISGGAEGIGLSIAKALGNQKMNIVIADINAGLLFILALTSLSVYGVILAGWASNS